LGPAQPGVTEVTGNIFILRFAATGELKRNGTCVCCYHTFQNSVLSLNSQESSAYVIPLFLINPYPRFCAKTRK